MFWGLIMEPQRRYTQQVKKAFHISMAALDLSTSSDEPAQVMCGFEGRNYLLCTLKKPDMLQCPLDLNFDVGSEVSFAANGKCHVHLTGYLTDDFADLSDEDEDEEEEEEEVKDTAVKSKKRNKKDSENGPKSKKLKTSTVSSSQNQEEEQSDSDDSSDLDVNALLGDSLQDDSDEDDSDVELEEDAGEEEDEEDEEGDNDEDDDGEEESEDNEDEEESSLSEADSDEENEAPRNSQPKMNGVVKKAGQEVKPKKDKKNKEKQQNENKKESGKSPKGEQKSVEVKKTPKKENQTPKRKTLQGGLIVEDIREGDGPSAKNGRFVNVYYEGRLKQNNKLFDSTTKGAGFSFRLGSGEVIKGWDIGVVGMKPGGKRKIICPPNMAYGQKGSPPAIPPNSTLVFEVELKKIS